jgi:predicted ferric reductase
VNRLALSVFWIGLYLLVVLAPVFVMFAPPVPSGRPFLVELSVALGFVGLTQIAAQFALVARFKRLTAPYGIDVILRYHRQIAMVAVFLILAHPILLVIEFPPRAELLNPLGGNVASRLAWIAMLALGGLIATSVFRKRIRLSYETWRLVHLILAAAALIFAQLHVSLAGLYLNRPWKHGLWIGVAVLMVAVELYLRLVRPALQRTRPWRVVEVRPERGDVSSLVLEAQGHDGMRFEPGQFAWLKLGASPFTLDEHPFSFSSSAEQSRRVEFGIKALGDFTQKLPEVEPGTVAYLDGPHGAFSIDRGHAPGYVFIAGGIGITPLLSCLRTMADREDRRPVLLLNAQNTWEDVPFREALAELEHELDLEIVHVLSRPEGDWQGERGFIDDAVLERALPEEKIVRDYLICGPLPMMNAVIAALQRRGVPAERILLEKFDLV